MTKRTEFQRVQDNVKKLTDLLFDRDKIVYFQQRIEVPRQQFTV